MGAQATTKAKKIKIKNVHKTMNLRPFKLYRVYLDPLYLLNVSNFSLELNSYGLYPGSKRKVRPRMFTSSIKRLFTFTS